MMFTRECVDIVAYNAKFSRVSRWCSLSASERNSVEGMLEYGSMLRDPTLFAYLHQRVDGLPLRLYPYQDMIANDGHRYRYFRASNQIGKSLLLDSLAARNLIWDHGHGHNEAIVSKSLPQSTFQMRRIKTLLRTMPDIDWSEVRGETDSLSVISVDVKEDIVDDSGRVTGQRVKYTNYLICAPCTEGLLGYDLHSLNLDEFEFWSVDLRYFFNQIAQPRTYHTKGRITIFTNPNGADNFGAECEKQMLPDGSLKWHVYVFNYLDKPGNTVEEYEQLKQELSRSEFESTVDAVRTLSDRYLFSRSEIENSRDSALSKSSLLVEGRVPVFFLDVAAKFDKCVLVGGWCEPDTNPLYTRVYIPFVYVYPRGYPISLVVGSPSESENVDGWEFHPSVRDVLLEHGRDGVLPMFGCDVTGNSGISPLFHAIGIYPIDVQFSGQLKSAYYQKFKYYMEKGLLHRCISEQWESEASQVIVTRSARGYWLVNAASTVTKEGQSVDAKLKKTPDDCMDATVGLIHLLDNTTLITPTLVKITR